jgi:hypothetical protein
LIATIITGGTVPLLLDAIAGLTEGSEAASVNIETASSLANHLGQFSHSLALQEVWQL